MIRIYDSFDSVKHHIFNDNAGEDRLRIAPEGSYSSGGITINQDGNVGIGSTSPSAKLTTSGTTDPSQKLDVEGYVQAYGYYTGDIVFQKDGQKLWRIFEEEDGLYLENLTNNKVSRVILEEDYVSLTKRIEELEKKIVELISR